MRAPPMARLIRFLLKLASELFYGEVQIHFQRGQIRKVEVHQHHLEDNLPEPDVTSPAYQKLLAETARGVES